MLIGSWLSVAHYSFWVIEHRNVLSFIILHDIYKSAYSADAELQYTTHSILDHINIHLLPLNKCTLLHLTHRQARSDPLPLKLTNAFISAYRINRMQELSLMTVIIWKLSENFPKLAERKS